MKEEFAEKIALEFIGLRSKMYFLQLSENNENIKKAKGVKNM